jgi:hypothetical protein
LPIHAHESIAGKVANLTSWSETQGNSKPIF